MNTCELTSQKVFIGASGFQTSILSGECNANSASIACWATSGIVGW